MGHSSSLMMGPLPWTLQPLILPPLFLPIYFQFPKSNHHHAFVHVLLLLPPSLSAWRTFYSPLDPNWLSPAIHNPPQSLPLSSHSGTCILFHCIVSIFHSLYYRACPIPLTWSSDSLAHCYHHSLLPSLFNRILALSWEWDFPWRSIR